MKKLFIILILLVSACGSDNPSAELVEVNKGCYSCIAWYPDGSTYTGYTLWTATTNTGDCSATTPFPSPYDCDTTKFDCSNPSSYSIMSDYCN